MKQPSDFTRSLRRLLAKTTEQQLLGERYALELQQLNVLECQLWVGCASRLRRLQAAMIMYGVDFEPAGLLFTHEIRPKKPEGLSGLEMRERHDCYVPALRKFHHAFRMMNADFTVLATVFVNADARYTDCHTLCMQKVLPTPDGSRPESLRKKYMEKYGKVRSLDDKTLWSALRKCPSQNTLSSSAPLWDGLLTTCCWDTDSTVLC
jgi:hypothetical protein